MVSDIDPEEEYPTSDAFQMCSSIMQGKPKEYLEVLEKRPKKEIIERFLGIIHSKWAGLPIVCANELPPIVIDGISFDPPQNIQARMMTKITLLLLIESESKRLDIWNQIKPQWTTTYIREVKTHLQTVEAMAKQYENAGQETIAANLRAGIKTITQANKEYAIDLENKSPARGVKFYFIIKQDIPEKEHISWQELILLSSPLSKWFKRVQFEYFDHPALISDCKGWNLIKIFCPDSQISMKASEAKSTYAEIFIQFSEWFIKFCRDRRIECKPYDFRILFRLSPPENAHEFVPIPSLSDIFRKIISPPTILPNPPTTPEAMFAFAQTSLSGRAFEMTLQYAEKKKVKVYSSYGFRTEKDSNTYELDMVMPSQSEEIESMRSLKGELWHSLILQSQEKASTDFNNVVNALLKKLMQDGAIDSQKLKHIYSNPGDYVEETQRCRRFVLKFDLKKWRPDSELGKALDVVKKQFQKELIGTKYSLYGAVSYKLTNEDLPRIEAVINDVVYFRNAKQDDLFTIMSIRLGDSTYDRIIEIAKKTDEILCSNKIITSAMATDIEDAKNRWKAAVSDLIRDGRKAASFIFFREIGIPLQMFIGAHESLYRELNKIAETHIDTIITSDNQMKSIRYGCYVIGRKTE